MRHHRRENMPRSVLIAVACCAMLVSCDGGTPKRADANTTEAAPAPDPNKRVRDITEDSVRMALKDPGSANFRSVAVYRNGKLVCGEVNAKNSFGAYAGYEEFVADGDRLYMESATPHVMRKEHKKCFAALNAETAALKARTIFESKGFIADNERRIAQAKADRSLSPEIRDNLVRSLEGILATQKRDLAEATK
jgi:hypothetical protein